MRVSAVHGQSFFCRRVEIPSDVTEDEQESYLQLQLEGLSPFPLEHLQFGFVVDAARRFAFLYSGYRRSFDNAAIAQWEKQEAVIPEFSIGALAGKGESGSPLLLVSEASISYFEFDDQSELPCYFESFSRTCDEEGQYASASDDIEIAKASLGEKGNQNGIRIWNTTTSISIEKNTLLLRASEAGQDILTEVDRDTLWLMDLREPDSIDRAKQEEQRNGLVWKVVLGMAALFALLFMGELIWVAEKSYLSLRTGWNTEQAPMVDRVISQQTTINELLSFEDSDLIPFDMLVAVQPFLTDAVWFTKVETNGPNSLKVYANATSNGQANQFKARLERFVKIENVELRDIQGRTGGTTFTAILDFKPGAFSENLANKEASKNGQGA